MHLGDVPGLFILDWRGDDAADTNDGALDLCPGWLVPASPPINEFLGVSLPGISILLPPFIQQSLLWPEFDV